MRVDGTRGTSLVRDKSRFQRFTGKSFGFIVVLSSKWFRVFAARRMIGTLGENSLHLLFRPLGLQTLLLRSAEP
jgi:hypothetical protein